MRTSGAVTLTLLLAAGLAACGEDTGTPEGATPMPSTSSPDPGKSPLEDLTVSPTGRPDKRGATLTLRGTISPGVEANCHLLAAGGTTYQLVWRGGVLVDGQQVVVQGKVRADLLTTCQQGVPFEVQRLTRS